MSLAHMAVTKEQVLEAFVKAGLVNEQCAPERIEVFLAGNKDCWGIIITEKGPQGFLYSDTPNYFLVPGCTYASDIKNGAICFERDEDGNFFQVVPLGFVAERSLPTTKPWWERHYTLDTVVSTPACNAPVPVPVEITTIGGTCNGDPKGTIFPLWHEKAAKQESQRFEEILALRRFIRRDITGME